MAASLFTKVTTRGFYIAGQGKWMDNLDSGNGEWDFSDLSHFYFLSVLRTSGITCHPAPSIQHPNHYIIIYISSISIPVNYSASHVVYSSEFKSEASRPRIRIIPWFWGRQVGVISDTLNIRLRLFPAKTLNVNEKRARNRIRAPLRPCSPKPSDEKVQDDCKHDRAYDTSNNCTDRPLAQRVLMSGRECRCSRFFNHEAINGV